MTQSNLLDPERKGLPPEDPENDAYRTEMTFWSENHQVLFATAEYLAGQLWPRTIFRVGNSFRREGAGKTRSTDLLGSQRMDRAKPRLLRWLNDRMRFGFSEWNSPGYYDEDLTALFNNLLHKARIACSVAAGVAWVHPCGFRLRSSRPSGADFLIVVDPSVARWPRHSELAAEI